MRAAGAPDLEVLSVNGTNLAKRPPAISFRIPTGGLCSNRVPVPDDRELGGNGA
jgi:hypothetical protein